MRDGYRRLVADAHAEKGIPEEHDDLIKGVVDAGLQLMRERGGASRANKRNIERLVRRVLLVGRIEKLPRPNQRQLLAEDSIERLRTLMREAGGTKPPRTQ